MADGSLLVRAKKMLLEQAKDYTELLPPELLSGALDHLPHGGVLYCARVSRRWRGVALAHSSFYRHMALSPRSRSPWTPSWVLQVSTFCDDLRNCAERGVRVSLDLHVADARATDDSWNVWNVDSSTDAEDPSHDARLWTEHVLPAVRDHIGIVIKLTIAVAPTHWDVTWAFLCRPAPQLRSLSLNSTRDRARVIEDQQDSLPCELFAGCAPLLKSVTLLYFQLGSTQLDAFRAVTRVFCAGYIPLALRRLGTHFPAMTDLIIQGLLLGESDEETASRAPPLAPTLRYLEIRGLQLACRYPSHLMRVLRLRTVSRINISFEGQQAYLDPFITDPPSQLSLDLTDYVLGDEGNLVSIDIRSPSASARPYQRTFCFNGGTKDYRGPDSWLVTAQLAPLATTLTDIRLRDPGILYRLFYAFKELPVLTHLHIHLEHGGHVWQEGSRPRSVPCEGPPERDSESSRWLAQESTYYSIDCPRLDHFALYNSRPGGRVSGKKVAALAQDLSLWKRALRSKDGPTATLALYGLQFDEPGVHLALPVMFKDICLRPYCSADVAPAPRNLELIYDSD